jgi:hypothetical protein
MEELRKETLHLNFVQKVWLVPILASAAFLLILSITWLGGQDQARLLKRIQSDYYQGGGQHSSRTAGRRHLGRRR